jgi:hypothetical protein
MQPGEMLPVELRVDLRGAEIRVAEQFLDRSEVRPALKQMGGETMAKYVRADPVG